MAELTRIHWPICSGFGGRFTPESLADLHRIMHQRALIERVVMVLTHYCDARRCRGRGLAYADFQAKMSAVTYDLKWLLRRT